MALLAPLSGPSAALGRVMQRAVAMSGVPGGSAPATFDTAAAPGPAGAAARAVKQGARIIIGPLFGPDVRPVMETVGDRALVLTLSNDAAQRDSGAFLLGITPSQSTSAILSYALDRGVRTVAVVAGESGWAQAVALEAERLQSILGLTVRRVGAEGVADLSHMPDPPHAVLVPDGGPDAQRLSRAVSGTGIQMLATIQAVDHRPESLAAFDGAWLAMPDPDAFDRFARTFAQQGDSPGLVAALAHDGAMIARQLIAGSALDRAGLLAGRYAGASGALRFRSDGACIRELAIAVVHPGGYRVMDRRTAA